MLVSYSVEAAATYLKCSPQIVRRLLAEGRLSANSSGAILEMNLIQFIRSNSSLARVQQLKREEAQKQRPHIDLAAELSKANAECLRAGERAAEIEALIAQRKQRPLAS